MYYLQEALSTFFKSFLGRWIQPVLPHFCCLVIDVIWACRKLAFRVEVMVAQGRVHFSV